MFAQQSGNLIWFSSSDKYPDLQNANVLTNGAKYKYMMMIKSSIHKHELGSISVRVLINESASACDLGKHLLLGVRDFLRKKRD